MPYSQKKKVKKSLGKKSTIRKYRINGGKTRKLDSKPVKFTSLKPTTVTTGEGGLLKYQSPSSYAQSLLDPFKYQDVRIPDLSTHPTGVYSVTKDFTFTYNDTTATSDVGNCFIVALGSVPFYQPIVAKVGGNRVEGTDIAGKARTNFSQSRLVSAGLVMRYNGNDANCTGNITAACLSALDQVGNQVSYGTGGANCPISMTGDALLGGQASTFFGKVADATSLAAVRNSYFGPVVDGCRLTYRPLDSDDFSMRTTWSQVSTWTTVAGYNQNVFSLTDEELISITAPIPHYFIVKVSGVGTSVPTFNVSLTLNYEGIPVDDTVGVPLAGVYCNPASQAYGLNMAANTRQCTSATTYEMSKVDKMVRGL